MTAVISCDTDKKTNLLTIQIDSDINNSLKLSDITDNIEAVELETTDLSLISKVKRVLHTKDYIIINESKTIMIFDKAGKFIRQIGSIGQGPGEYTRIWDITADFKNKHIYIYTNEDKIICYDFDDNLIKESLPIFRIGGANYINCINGKLFLLSELLIKHENTKINRTFLYQISNDLLKSDSIKVHEFNHNGIWFHPYNDYITCDEKNIYLYYSDLSSNPFVLDTLYQLKDEQPIPHLNLSFNNKGLTINGKKEIYILNIYRSARYVFSYYKNISRDQFYFFCHDTKNGKSYNAIDGFTDDIYTGGKVIIRPFNSDANKFYYLHTNIDEGTNDEPNPTLYIGTLKK